jgi:hypothetical protein
MSYQPPPKYLPTPQEIAASCQAIQKTWSYNEQRRRARWAYDEEEVRPHFLPLEATTAKQVEYWLADQNSSGTR